MRLAIVGGGASGVFAAIALLREMGPRAEVSIFEPADQLGAGLAYGTNEASHLLNVPASKMSGLADRPGDFESWLRENAEEVFSDRHFPFVPRLYYRAYLQDRLRTIESETGGRVEWLREKIRSVEKSGDRWNLISDSGTSRKFTACFIASGFKSQPESAQLPIEEAAKDFIFPAYGEVDSQKIKEAAALVVIGTGLSAIDHWRGWREQGYEGVVYLISRRGLLPLPHLSSVPSLDLGLSGEAMAPRKLFRRMRELQKKTNCEWASIADGIRAQAAGIWSVWNAKQRRQFERHIKPYWEVIRHRVPTTVLDDLHKEIACGSVKIHAGRLRLVKKQGQGISLLIEGKAGLHEIQASLALNATGARVRAHPSIQGDGKDGIYLIGPAAKELHWEITAVPEIVRQVAQMAAALKPVQSAEADQIRG